MLALLTLTVGMTMAKSDAPDGTRTRKVAVCQTFCIDSDLDGNLARVEQALKKAVAGGAEVACFAEAVDLGWVNPAAHEASSPIPGPTSDRIAALAKKYGVLVCIGLTEKDGDKLYDSVILVDKTGEILAKHRKVNILAELMTPAYTCGDEGGVKVTETSIGRVGLLICADVFKESLVKAAGDQRPDLMLIPYGWAAAKDQWPEHGKSLASWVSSVARRVKCPVVGTNLVGAISSGPWKGRTYGGQSVVADGTGKVLGVLSDRDADVRVFELEIGSKAG
ncbi:MAG: carbon-nitrogen hydrolase family protein [Armatimonadetes bacterium]|nr:carbon-nitrogen hydrolase family protein [Armatimonadota bacterium]